MINPITPIGIYERLLPVSLRKTASKSIFNVLSESLNQKIQQTIEKRNNLQTNLSNFDNISKSIKDIVEELDNISSKRSVITSISKKKTFSDLVLVDNISTNKITTSFDHNFKDGDEIKFSNSDSIFYTKVINNKRFEVYENLNLEGDAVKFSKDFQKNPSLLFKSKIQTTVTTTQSPLVLGKRIFELKDDLQKELEKTGIKFNINKLSESFLQNNISGTKFSLTSLIRGIEKQKVNTLEQIKTLDKEQKLNESSLRTLGFKDTLYQNKLRLLDTLA